VIERRTFLAGTGAVLLAAPLAAEAQQAGKVYRIGVLSTTGPEQENFIWSGFRGQLRERGWVVCRTWALRGNTPVLTHVGGNWKRLSVAGALAFRWDGRRARFFFQTQPG